jgi:hypothetical protein
MYNYGKEFGWYIEAWRIIPRWQTNCIFREVVRALEDLLFFPLY